MKLPPDIQSCAGALLALDPDPVPRFLSLRDILKLPPSDRALQEAKKAMLRSRWVAELATEQLPHGGWARFHSMDTKSKNKIFTTEYGVLRAVHIGLDGRDTILTRARRYLIALLNKQLPWPEHKEANDRWASGEEMFIASALAWIDPGSPALEKVYAKWCRIAEQTFATGRFDAEAEARAHGLAVSGTNCVGYLGLRNRHAVYLLAKAQDRLRDVCV